jgi:hypothetical protein
MNILQKLGLIALALLTLVLDRNKPEVTITNLCRKEKS